MSMRVLVTGAYGFIGAQIVTARLPLLATRSCALYAARRRRMGVSAIYRQSCAISAMMCSRMTGARVSRASMR